MNVLSLSSQERDYSPLSTAVHSSGLALTGLCLSCTVGLRRFQGNIKRFLFHNQMYLHIKSLHN